MYGLEYAIFAVMHDRAALQSMPIQLAAQVVGAIAPVIQPITIGVLVINVICYLLFVYRAVSNLTLSNAHGLDVSPGWAVGWSFIPLANLVKIPSVMRQAWRASANPVRPPPDVPAIFNVWWGAWITANIIGSFAGRLADGLDKLAPDQMAERFLPIALLSTVGCVLSITATFCLLDIIGQITRLQRELREATVFS